MKYTTRATNHAIPSANGSALPVPSSLYSPPLEKHKGPKVSAQVLCGDLVIAVLLDDYKSVASTVTLRLVAGLIARIVTL